VHAAIVLAAGASSRMGRPKPLLPWRGTTLLGYALQQLSLTGIDRVVVVLGLAHAEVRAAVPSLSAATVVLNLNEASERSGSIRLGAQAVSDSVDAVVVQSVDQPCSAAVLRLLLAANADVAIPTYAARRGHPVVFHGRLLPELRQVEEATQGLRAVVRRHQPAIVEVPVDDPAVIWNLNDPQTYAAATQHPG
jgi:molybdenum cofactor cytidylyltransferase